MAVSYAASAPGKTIIHGEHAVVYGKASVAASVDLRTSVTCTEQESLVVLEACDLDISASWPVSKFLCFSVPKEGYSTEVIPSSALAPSICECFEVDGGSAKPRDQAELAFLFLFTGIALRHNNGQFVPAKFSVSSKLPLGAGLGSSASYSTALAAVLLARCDVVRHPLSSDNRALISAWAFQAECILHGRPSGIDNTICTYAVEVTRQLVSAHRIPSYRVLLVNTQVPRNTKALVAGVKTRHDKFPEVIKPVLDSIEAISETFWKLLKGSPSGD
ncbi:hypothetical protein HPB48_011248 [Haemaphysalis longicornis]|uniref:mevalonate kinase n=1 Tax=Haemaphysalis longicornis TaxID=44386 RepID=A0A9J6GU16_HAELO|nr:hypothetical protein HPB48_011248 [Haemaphysalis longicornis]